VLDTLHEMFVNNRVVALKPNPVNAYLGPLIEDGFQTLIDRGYLRIIYGGSDEGSYVGHHHGVDGIHLTGSDKTFEAIVFGAGTEGERRKAGREPLTRKQATCELGNVSPIIIVPGPWSRRDVWNQAEHLATWLVGNAGFGCLTPRVLIQHKSWEQREALVEAIEGVLAGVETRNAYYPGARDRHAAFMAAHPEGRQFGNADGDHLPWTFITDVDPDDADDICFTREAFCSLFAETALVASSISDFVDQAVEFANQTLWGTLNATVIVHPDSMADHQIAASVERAIAALHYGTVAVNLFAYYSYYFGATPWGGFPGHDIYDVQSGIGKTANALMFDRPQKSVVRAPFRRLDPITVASKHPKEFSMKLLRLEAAPTLWRVPGLLWTALRS
jgi:acyl-CoA reductase-like NAD-dependent aldehyde dehydrogenase